MVGNGYGAVAPEKAKGGGVASRYTTLNWRGKRLREPTNRPEKEEGRER